MSPAPKGPRLYPSGPIGGYAVMTRATGAPLGTVQRATYFGIVGWYAYTPDRTKVPSPYGDRGRWSTRAEAVAALVEQAGCPSTVDSRTEDV